MHLLLVVHRQPHRVLPAGIVTVTVTTPWYTVSLASRNSRLKMVRQKKPTIANTIAQWIF